MNKSELVNHVQQSLGEDATKAMAERAVEAVLDSIKAGVKKDTSVQLVGFGTFAIAERAARVGVNPKTKEKIQIAASKSVKFKPGAALKEAVQ